MKKITLIGGAPLSGKTTLSKELSKRDAAIELSSDSVRSWMKQLVSTEDYPGLFYSSNMTAEEFYDVHTTPQSVIDGEIAQGIQVEKGIISLLNSDIGWNHLILEGIAITPEFMERVKKLYSNVEVECIILVDQNNQRIHKRISNRGLWGPLDTYPNSLITTEVKWVILYNQWFLEQAEKYSIEVRYN